jgi:hypothetical protein
MTTSADVAACVDIMCEQCVDISVMMAVYQLTQCRSPTTLCEVRMCMMCEQRGVHVSPLSHNMRTGARSAWGTWRMFLTACAGW